MSSGESMKQRSGGPSFSSKNSSIQNSREAELPSTIIMDVYHIIRDLTLFFCRRIIFGPIYFKLLVSLAIIVIGSLLKASSLAPNSYLSVKTNIFNIYFAKLGWAWTIGLLAPFIYLTSMSTYNQYQILTHHLTRLLIATGVWYIITSLFVRIEAYTGSCTTAEGQGLSRKVCLKGGYDWQEGIDFSGHTFLLLYAILIINEEVKSYDQGTKKLKEASKTNTNANAGDTLSNTNQTQIDIIGKIIRILYVLLAALTILWEFMLLSTALYFHHTLHKLMAAAIAIFFWYITYYVWYQPDSTSLLRPFQP